MLYHVCSVQKCVCIRLVLGWEQLLGNQQTLQEVTVSVQERVWHTNPHETLNSDHFGNEVLYRVQWCQENNKCPIKADLVNSMFGVKRGRKQLWWHYCSICICEWGITPTQLLVQACTPDTDQTSMHGEAWPSSQTQQRDSRRIAPQNIRSGLVKCISQVLSTASSTGSITAAVWARRRAKHRFVRELRGETPLPFPDGQHPIGHLPFHWNTIFMVLPVLSSLWTAGSVSQGSSGMSRLEFWVQAAVLEMLGQYRLLVLRKRTSLTSGNIF